MQELRGKVAVVTGAGSGIGRAIALRVSSEGMRVALADLDDSALDDTTSQLIDAGAVASDVLRQVTDVSDEGSVTALADHVFETWGRVDLLVNNAGVFAGGVMWERPASDFEFTLGVNLWGILHGIRAFVPRMIAQGGEGHIVNTCSSAGLLASPFAAPYNISKFAAVAASECLALDLAAIGAPIKVTALCPGFVRTELTATSKRVRPATLATEPTIDAQLIGDALTEFLSNGIEPSDVADQVVDAIHTEQFMLLTHDHHRADAVTRAQQLAAGQLPAPGDYS